MIDIYTADLFVIHEEALSFVCGKSTLREHPLLLHCYFTSKLHFSFEVVTIRLLQRRKSFYPGYMWFETIYYTQLKGMYLFDGIKR